jgi:hypothetical protein
MNQIKSCECCIHANASWCFLSAKGFKKAFRSYPNPSENFSGFFWNLFSFFLSYFYLLEGSKILFMSSKYFIWIVHVPMCPREFSWNFCDFRSIFRVFKQFLEFFWNCFRIKNNFEKNKPYLTGPSPKARPRSAPAQPSARVGPI